MWPAQRQANVTAVGQHLVATIAIDLQDALEAGEMDDRPLGLAVGRIDIDDRRRIYAGAYAFGRTGSRVTIESGRKRIVRGFRKDRSVWEALILDHHDGYIAWTEFERNQRLISDNANGQSFMSRGAVRRGEALLRCGHCSRKLHVAYSGENGSSGRYHCRGGHLNHGGEPCISFGGMRIDRALAPR